MIYVEEISDNEKDSINKSFKQFEMQTPTDSEGGAKSKQDTSNDTINNDLTPLDIPVPKINTMDLTPGIIKTNLGKKLNGLEIESSKSDPTPKKVPPAITRGPKVFAHGEDLQTIESSLLFKTLQPIFTAMKAFGLFYISKKTSHKRGLSGLIRNCTPTQAYCSFILFILIGNFLRTLAALDMSGALDTVFFFKLLMIIFFYEAASRALIALIACSKKKGGLTDFFLNIDKVCYSDKIIPYENSLKHTMTIFLVMTLLLTLGNVGVMCYGFFGPADVQHLFNLYLIPIPADLPGIIAFKLFIILLTLINSAVALLSLSFYTIICYVLYKEFEYLCRTFAMKIKEDGTFVDDLEKFRLRHQKRCKLVEEADALFKAYIANTYLTNVPLLCLLLYNIVYTESGDSVVYR